jgi:hypothetical protein
MLNHFLTCLINRPAKFYEGNIYDIHIPLDFKGYQTTPYTEEIHRAIFNGLNADASFTCYRFFQFSHLINSCGLKQHILQFDSRITYDLDKQPNFFTECDYVVSIQPNIGLRVTRDETGVMQKPDNLSYQYIITRENGNIRAIPKVHSTPINYRQISPHHCRLDPIDTIIECETDGYWEVDILVKPPQALAGVINSTLERPTEIFQQLFEFVDTTNPEYSDAFWNITDNIYKFCALLFAQAIANEKLQANAGR